MNVNQFTENVELLRVSGFTLTQHESGLIENSLIILQRDNKFQDIFFWGRINTSGTEHYYVAFGYSRDILKDRKYFYSLNGYDWVMMPTMQPNLLPITRKVKSFFRGDPAHVEEVFMNPTFVPDDVEVFVQCRSAVKKIKEEDRLACVVHLIGQESAIVPRGALYLQINCCVTSNPFFRGLNRIEATLLKNFQLFRSPVNNCNYNLTKREDYNYQTDFFDTIDDLIPSNCFSLRINDRDICLIRSLKWPGMVFFHKLNTMYQGFCYFGNAKENMDLLFMLPN